MKETGGSEQEPITLNPLEQTALHVINSIRLGEHSQLKRLSSREAILVASQISYPESREENVPLENRVDRNDYLSASTVMETPVFKVKKDGYKIIVVERGAAITVPLDEKTAVVTYGLLDCNGYGIKNIAPRSKSTASVGHFFLQDSSPLFALRDFIAMNRGKKQEIQSIAYYLYSFIDGGRPSSADLLPAHKPTVLGNPATIPVHILSHSLLREAGLMITQNGGIFLDIPPNLNPLIEPTYSPKERFIW